MGIKEKSSCQALFKEFVEESSTHGIKRMFYSSAGAHSKVSRLIWCMAWLMAASYSIFQIYHVADDYLAYKSVTKYTLQDKGWVPFPAITVQRARVA